MADDDSSKKPGILGRIKAAATKAVGKVKEAAQLDFLARFKADDVSATPIDFPIDVGHETVWATQAQMADLFGVDQSAVAKHIKKIFDSNEIAEDEATHAKIALGHELINE